MHSVSDQLPQDIREICHGLGELRPRIDSMTEIRSVLHRQMALLIYKSKLEADKQGDGQISIKHIISVILNCKLTLVRVLSYYLLKENIYKLSKNSIGDTDNVSLEDNNIMHGTNDDIEALINPVNDETLSKINPMSLLSIDFTKSFMYSKAQLNKSIFKQLVYAIAELKPDIKITEEDVQNATEKRKIRVNNISIVLTTKRYESFQICRKKNFFNENGVLLLRCVHDYLPLPISYDKQAKDVFLFLAKETIASLLDHVFENRSDCDTSFESKQLEEEDILRIKKMKPENIKSILVEEIKNVTNSYWKKDLGDICFPYVKENNRFFENQLVFK